MEHYPHPDSFLTKYFESSKTEHHPALAPLSWLFGTWESIEAEAAYPTINTLKYNDVLDIQPARHPLPLLEYRSETQHPVNKSRIHCEIGYLRVDPKDGKLALLLAHNMDLSEVSEGSLSSDNKHELNLESKSLALPSFSELVTTKKIARQLKLVGDELHLSVQMQSTDQPLQKHLTVRYKKKQ